MRTTVMTAAIAPIVRRRRGDRRDAAPTPSRAVGGSIVDRVAEIGRGSRRERARARESVIRSLRHRLRYHVVDGLRQVGAVRRESRRRFHQVREHEGGVVLGVERRMSGEALEEHAAERVHVGPRVRDLTTELLGRRVVERPHELAGTGDARIARGPFGESEVGEVGVRSRFRASLTRDEHVRGLDVAVHEPLLVCGVEGRGDLADDPRCLSRLEPPLLAQQGAKIGALHVSHRDVQTTSGLAGLVDRDHVRVIDRGGELRLADETLSEPGIVC